MKAHIENNRGGTIVTVVILTTAISILISVLLATQYRAPHPNRVQALANARSALIKRLQEKPVDDTFAAQKSDSLLPQTLWKETRFGNALIEEFPSPFSLTYHAWGFDKSDTAKLIVSCGAALHLSDTTLVLKNRDPIEGEEMVSGTIVREDTTHTPPNIKLDRKALSESKKATDSLFLELDSITPSATISIFQKEDFLAMGTSLGGDLFIDGSDIDINGREQLYYIKGNLQLTGAVSLKAATFIVGGEVRINDQSSLSDVTIFAKSTIFLSHESKFSGRAISYGAIEILDNTTIENKSLLLSLMKAKKGKASIYIRGNAKVDATLFSRGSIYTFENSESTGVLYSMSSIVHKGYHNGIVIAKNMGNATPQTDEKAEKTSPENKTKAVQTNRVEGTITDIFKPTEYPLPWFIGRKKIIFWQEKR